MVSPADGRSVLIGQYDSPFVRRAAVAMHLHGITYNHRPWSTFADADLLADCTPLIRVPVLLLADGPPLIDSASILDHVDLLAGRSLAPAYGPARRRATYVTSLATGLAEKAVVLVYERVLHADPSPAWTERCTRQIQATVTALEAEAAAKPTPFWFGGAPGHADIALACALRFLAEAHPALAPSGQTPKLAAHAASCEALPSFQAAVQRFIPPH